MTPEPCVVCRGEGRRAATMFEDTMQKEVSIMCFVCCGSGKRPPMWAWAASLGPENSSEAGTGVKDATGGKREDKPAELARRISGGDIRGMANSVLEGILRKMVTDERERVLALIEAYIRDEAPIFTDSGVSLDFDRFVARIRGGTL